MRLIADVEEWKMPATIDDPAILEEIGEVLWSRGLAIQRKAGRWIDTLAPWRWRAPTRLPGGADGGSSQ